MRRRPCAADSRKSMGNEQPHRPRPKRRRARGQGPDGTPVVRLDIYASSEGVGARQGSPPSEPKPVTDTTELDRRQAEHDERERALATRAVGLERSEATLVARARGLDGREQELCEREAELANAHYAEIDLSDLER